MSDANAPEPSTVEFVVEPDSEGVRLDAYLAAHVDGLSRTRAQRAVDDADVLVNGKPSKSSLKLKVDDRVEIDLPDPPVSDVVPEAMDLVVVHEDDAFVVVDKPAGLVVHPGAGITRGTLANGLAYRYGVGAGGPAWRPGIVHRIDKDTSGLLVVARTPEAHVALSEQFAARTVSKHYTALVYGRVGADEGKFEKPIGRDPRVRVRMAALGPGRGRPALTLYSVTERYPETTLLDVDIRTGRTHQIRVHFADARHPVVADETYGPGRAKSLKDAVLRRHISALGRQFLHAASLAFDHPRTGERVAFTSPLPPELVSLLEYQREQAR